MNARSGFIAGDWTISPSRNLLTRGEDQVRVEPRVMDVLVHLAEHAGEVISKDDLIARIWPDRHVTDDVLTVTIYALRKALGDDARRPNYVETVSRRGYRWIAPISHLPRTVTPEPAASASAGPESAAAAPLTPATAPPAQRGQTPAHIRGWWIGLATVMAAVFALLAASAWWTESGGGRRGRPHVASAEAHEAYLKGRYFLDQRSITGWQQAREQFERAVSLDPLDPAAHAGLADTYSAMWDVGVASHDEMRPRALKAAKQALALDSQSAEGHEALGRVQFLFDWDFDAAQASLTQAIALDPDLMPAQQAMAWVASARGNHDVAAMAARRALQLDPVNTARYTELAWVLLLAGDRDEAQRVSERALQLNPRAFQALLMKGWTRELAGQPDEAFAAYSDALRILGAPDDALQRLHTVYRAEGLPGYYRRWLEPAGGRSGSGNSAGSTPNPGSNPSPGSPSSNSMPSSNSNSIQMPVSETWRAELYARMGQHDRAIEALERAYARREGALAWVNVDPAFVTLRANPRFQQIATRIPRRD